MISESFQIHSTLHTSHLFRWGPVFWDLAVIPIWDLAVIPLCTDQFWYQEPLNALNLENIYV